MNLPHLDVATAAPAEWRAALEQSGAVVVSDSSVARARFDQALADAATLLAAAAAAPERLAIERSPHFRGYSEVHTARDHRRQFHFGRERPRHPLAASEPFWRLQGENPWPESLALRGRLLAYLELVAGIGQRVLASIATTFGTSAARWLGDEPYLLQKCIAYHPQPTGTATRPGVAAHLDFSLLTLTLQDDVGGLQVRRRDGTWIDVEPRRGTWLLHGGELLAYATGHAIAALPHRVVNPSTHRPRLSMPTFLNPSLATVLRRGEPQLPSPDDPGEHVHAVLDPGDLPPTLAFGPAEWRRKGENRWCARCTAKSGEPTYSGSLPIA
ncbi:MAG: isopenicillin N synthase family oxygenase [Planctomycetes bacterium]|nr:isopenicillin N synthase family oxygenase [Planctomycetota bacterium]